MQVLNAVWTGRGFAGFDVFQVLAFNAQILIDVLDHLESLWSALASKYRTHFHFLFIFYLLVGSLEIAFVDLSHQKIPVFFLVVIRPFEQHTPQNTFLQIIRLTNIVLFRHLIFQFLFLHLVF